MGYKLRSHAKDRTTKNLAAITVDLSTCPTVTRNVIVSITKILDITPFLINIYIYILLISTLFLQPLNRSSEPGLSPITVRSVCSLL